MKSKKKPAKAKSKANAALVTAMRETKERADSEAEARSLQRVYEMPKNRKTKA